MAAFTHFGIRSDADEPLVLCAMASNAPASPMCPEQDAATIARAAELLRTDQAAYSRDVELQDAK
jgi:hypothetical protein